MVDKVITSTIGVVLLNLGGPDSLQAIKQFLYNLFSDRQIIRLGPSLMQKPIAWLISSVRAKKTERLYSLIGGKSPILDITKAQAKALEEVLNKHSLENNSSLVPRPSPLPFKVYVAMRYWHPLIEEVVQEIYKDGISKIIVLSLYPQYSLATTGSSLSRLKEALARIYCLNSAETEKINSSFENQEIRNKSSFTIHSSQFTVHCLTSWFNHPLYIEALVGVIKRGIESFKISNLKSQISDLDVHVLFSAHSLPRKFVDEGDPYVNQITGTIREITKRIQIKWHLSYQSRSGPVRWLEPSTDDKLRELAGKGVKNILVVPISFVSDHIETLYEIDILYTQMAEKLGIRLRRTESLNTHPIFIESLKDIVIKHAKELGWAE